MRVHEVDSNVDSGALLAGAQFVDAYSIAIDGAALDARQAAEKMLARLPRWIEVLLALTTSTWIFASWWMSQASAIASA